MEIKRIYHGWDRWEDHKNGFYNNASGDVKKEMLQSVVELFSDQEMTKHYMSRVINEWYYSCQHNLTNEAMNKIAYLGQGACCIYADIPSTVTMEGWSLVPQEHQEKANKIAEEVLKIWEGKHISDLIQMSNDNKC